MPASGSSIAAPIGQGLFGTGPAFTRSGTLCRLGRLVGDPHHWIDTNGAETEPGALHATAGVFDRDAGGAIFGQSGE